jgi:hypothetical protein
MPGPSTRLAELHSTQKTAAVSFQDSESLPKTLPTIHYHVSESRRHAENLTRWLSENNDDPALKVCHNLSNILHSSQMQILQNFLPDLKDHILSRLLGHSFDGDEHEYSDEDRNAVHFVNNRIYQHKVIQINYTTYDMQCSQDSINPRTHPDIMVLSHEDEDCGSDGQHPYWYARVVGIFHADVRHLGPKSQSDDAQHLDFLWVRWFGRDLDHAGGWLAHRLHRVGFLHQDQLGAFGFLDPVVVIRGVHMIPAFAYGPTSSLLGPSIARQPSENDDDWNFYYVGM